MKAIDLRCHSDIPCEFIRETIRYQTYIILSMESSAITFFSILGTVFVCSFIFLILLCRYKTLRKNATRHVKNKKMDRLDLRHSEMEMVMVDKKAGLVKRFLRQYGTSGALSERCQQLLDLCNTIDLSSKKVTQPDIQKIHAIAQMARSITEESDGWEYLEGQEKAELLEKSTACHLQQVSMAMAAMEARLGALKTCEELCCSEAELKTSLHYRIA